MPRSNRRIRRKGKTTSARAALTGEPDPSANSSALAIRTNNDSSTPDIKMLAKALKLDVSDELLDYAMGNDWKEKQQQQQQQQQEHGKGKHKKITKPIQMSTREHLKRKYTRKAIAKLATSTVNLRQSTHNLQVSNTQVIYSQANIWMIEAKYLANISNYNRHFEEEQDNCNGSGEHNHENGTNDNEDNSGSADSMVSDNVKHHDQENNGDSPQDNNTNNQVVNSVPVTTNSFQEIGESQAAVATKGLDNKSNVIASDTASSNNNKPAKAKKEHTVGPFRRLFKFWGSSTCARGSKSCAADVNNAAKTVVDTTANADDGSSVESTSAGVPKDDRHTNDAVLDTDDIDTDKNDNSNADVATENKQDQDDRLVAKPKPKPNKKYNKRADSPETCISDESETECTASTAPGSSFDGSDSEEGDHNGPVQEEKETSDSDDDSDDDDSEDDDDYNKATTHLNDLPEDSSSDAFANLAQILFHPTLYHPLVTVKTARDLKRLKKTMTKAFLTQPELQKVVATSALVKKLQADHLRYGGSEDRCMESKGCRCEKCKDTKEVVVKTLVNSFLNSFVRVETKAGGNGCASAMDNDKGNDVGDQGKEEQDDHSNTDDMKATNNNAPMPVKA